MNRIQEQQVDKRIVDIFKDRAKKIMYKNESRINQIISNSINSNLSQLKSTKTETSSNVSNKSYNKYEDKFPFIKFGLVTSTFALGSQVETICQLGLLIESNIVLVSHKSIALEKDEDEIYQLLDIEFKLLNLSHDKAEYLPISLKVKGFYTPYESKMKPEEKVLNCWGLISLEMPVGGLIDYFLNQERRKDSHVIKNTYDEVRLEHLTNDEIESSQIIFCEIGSNINKEENRDCEYSPDDIQQFQFLSSFYNTKVEDQFIHFNRTGKDESPTTGFILCFLKQRYYLVGIGQTKAEVYSPNSNVIYCNRSIRINEEIINKITLKIEEFKLNETHKLKTTNDNSTIKIPNLYSNNSFDFSSKLFMILDKEIKSKQMFTKLISDDCKDLKLLFGKIKSLNNDYRTFSNEEKISIDTSPKTFPNKCIQLILTLIWNRLINQSTKNSLKKSELMFENLNVGSTGSPIISYIFKSNYNLSCLNLKGNNLFSSGVKNIIEPIYNTKHIIHMGSGLRILNFDKNKLTSKSIKYLYHLIKVSPNLEVLSLDHNYINSKGLNYLSRSLKGKEKLVSLSLAYNMLSSDSGSHLASILNEAINITYLNLEGNNLCDESLISVLTTEGRGDKLKRLYLGSNNLTSKSANYISAWLETTNNLESLWLNNNNFSDEGIYFIGKSLSTKTDSNLSELNLSSVNLSPEGAAKFFDIIKTNISLTKLNLNYNSISDKGCESLAKLLEEQTKRGKGLISLSLSGTEISDSGANLIYNEVMIHPSLAELKMNSNLITEKGGEILLYAVLCNNSIKKFHLENNSTKFGEVKNLSFRNVREDLQIFLN